MDEKRKRGRPRKSPSISNTGDSTFDSKQSIENAIDKTQFDFFEPTSTAMPEVNSFNPLSETPIERDYATPRIQEGLVVDLEEPTFHQKSFDQIKSEQATPPTSSVGGAPVGMSNDPMMNPNPAMNQLDDAERRMASESMVDAVLDTYDTLCTLGSAVGKVKEQTVNQLISSGKIDKNRRIPVDEYGNTVSVIEFVQGYNEQVAQAVQPDPAFRKKVRPPMIRVFSKRGWGMTDEQFLLFAFGKDISVKAITLFSMKKGVNDILKRLVAENAENNSASTTPPPRPQSPPPPPPAPAPNYPPTSPNDIITPEVEEITDEEINYYERMQDAIQEREAEVKAAEEERIRQEESGVQKMKINFDDNPLRENTRREPPAPKVTETFIKGGEI
jgi:hypothetical protein